MMGSGYQLIALADARPGMVLSDVLLDRVGQVLLPRGAVLTAAALASLERHGLGMVPVLTETRTMPDHGQVQARLDHIFRHVCRDGEDYAAAGVLRCHLESYRLAPGGAE
jgi:hypothetical protein